MTRLVIFLQIASAALALVPVILALGWAEKPGRLFPRGRE